MPGRLGNPAVKTPGNLGTRAIQIPASHRIAAIKEPDSPGTRASKADHTTTLPPTAAATPTAATPMELRAARVLTALPAHIARSRA